MVANSSNAVRGLLLGVALGVASTAATASPRPEGTSVAASPASLRDAENLTPRFSSDRARAKGAQADARLAIVRDAALGYGVLGGYAERAREIQERVQQHGDQLDRVWNFTPFVDAGRLLAPAVQYTHHEQILDDGKAALRETGKVLRVTEPARLVTMPPTWRDWLSIAAAEVVRPDDTSLPQDDNERDVWKSAIASAWQVGRAQADAVFETQIEALTNAYVDRLRYKELVAQHMIGPAKLGEMNLGIVREDDVVRIEDAIYSVSSKARFTAPAEWRPVVSKPSAAADTALDREGASP